MDQLATNFKCYIVETLDIDPHPEQWPEAGSLPIFLLELYAFFEVRILKVPCLVMAARGRAGQTPATIRKHMLQVRKKWPDELIYLQQSMTAYNRKRFIQHKIPFVVPQNQMYLPFIGIDLREHFKRIRQTEEGFSPSTQVVVLHYLSQRRQLRLTPKTLANALGYSIMTMTRALDELDGSGLGTIVMEGRERVLRFNRDRKQVWETALQRMRSPVQKRVWVKTSSSKRLGVQAGLTALAHYSHLAEPANPVCALDGKQWKEFEANQDLTVLDIAEPDACELEVWRYSPMLFAENGVVDRLSLCLSMREDMDERVQSALQGLMEQVEW